MLFTTLDTQTDFCGAVPLRISSTKSSSLALHSTHPFKPLKESPRGVRWPSSALGIDSPKSRRRLESSAIQMLYPAVLEMATNLSLASSLNSILRLRKLSFCPGQTSPSFFTSSPLATFPSFGGGTTLNDSNSLNLPEKEREREKSPGRTE